MERRYHGRSNGLWFTESVASAVAEINPTSHVISEFPTPTPASGPVGITTEPDRFECLPPGARNPSKCA
jgi:virginiamycin B lyase